MARDLEAQVRSLPPDNPLPSRLPFDTSVEAIAGPRVENRLRVLSPRSPLGLQLRSEGDAELNWTVETRVSYPRADGSAGMLVSLLSSGVQGLTAGVATDVFSLNLTPGTYRVDLGFLDSTGASLGTYFEYVRVVEDPVNPQLALDRRVVSPGERLRVRVENAGAETIGYGYFYTLQRYDHHRWRQAPQVDHFFAPLFSLPGGWAGRCQAVRILPQAGPGRYRILKKVRVSSQGSRERTLAERFRVRD